MAKRGTLSAVLGRCAATAASLLVAVALANLLASCSAPPPPNVLIFVLDTTRADAVGAYGGDPAFTHHLDRLAAEGALFVNARATSPWTLPSHASLFTGAWVARHNAHNENLVLGEANTTLAELLQPTYATAGFCENPNLLADRGFAQGFDLWDESWRRRSSRELPPDTLERARTWLDTRDPTRPFFLFINLMTPHLPYAPLETWYRPLIPEGVPQETIERLRQFDEPDARRLMTGSATLEEGDREVLERLYRADVAWADARIGVLLDALRADGTLDRTLVVAMSDHGESFGDHGLWEHQLSIYETLLRIPLILRLPGVFAPGERHHHPVQVIDVMPTVLDLAGIPRTRWPPVDGVSLASGESSRDRQVIAEYFRPVKQRALFEIADPSFDFSPYWRRLRSIQLGRYKLIVSDLGHEEVYDLEADPGETRNLRADHPVQRDALARVLAAWSRQWAPPEIRDQLPTLDAEAHEALRALGYLD